MHSLLWYIFRKSVKIMHRVRRLMALSFNFSKYIGSGKYTRSKKYIQVGDGGNIPVQRNISRWVMEAIYPLKEIYPGGWWRPSHSAVRWGHLSPHSVAPPSFHQMHTKYRIVWKLDPDFIISFIYVIYFIYILLGAPLIIKYWGFHNLHHICCPGHGNMVFSLPKV